VLAAMVVVVVREVVVEACGVWEIGGWEVVVC
jgi:hypothetical protein